MMVYIVLLTVSVISDRWMTSLTGDEMTDYIVQLTLLQNDLACFL